VKSIYNIKSSQGHPCPDAVGKSQTGASVLARNLWFYLYLSDIWLEEHWEWVEWNWWDTGASVQVWY